MKFTCVICGKELTSEQSAKSSRHINSKIHQDALHGKNSLTENILIIEDEGNECTTAKLDPQENELSIDVQIPPSSDALNSILREIENINGRLTAIERNLGISVEKRRKMVISTPNKREIIRAIRELRQFPGLDRWIPLDHLIDYLEVPDSHVNAFKQIIVQLYHDEQVDLEPFEESNDLVKIQGKTYGQIAVKLEWMKSRSETKKKSHS